MQELIPTRQNPGRKVDEKKDRLPNEKIESTAGKAANSGTSERLKAQAEEIRSSAEELRTQVAKLTTRKIEAVRNELVNGNDPSAESKPEAVKVKQSVDQKKPVSTIGKLWPFRMNRHRNMNVQGVEFSNLDIAIPGIPNKYATITEGVAKIYLFRKIHLTPTGEGALIKFGDGYLQYHLNVEKSAIGSEEARKDVRAILKKMVDLKLDLPIVGDGPNPAINRLFEKLGAVRTNCPLSAKILARLGYGIERLLGHVPPAGKMERTILMPEKNI